MPVTGSGLNNGTVLVPQTQSDEHSYLASLLADTHRGNEKLMQQLKEQFRQSLEDSEIPGGGMTRN